MTDFLALPSHAQDGEDKKVRVLGWKGPKRAAQLIRRARATFG